jgi:L-seryl-tRNA(Ser) seleniumtransferase
MAPPKTNRVSALPAIETLLQRDEVSGLIERYGRPACTQALRDVVSAARQGLLAGDAIDITEAALTAQASMSLEAAAQPHLRPVLNLTGTVLHTNLGRALLPAEAVTAMIEAATRPSNLEYDLDRLKRGDRDDHIEADLRALTGAEAATVVNNNAAAVLLVLNSLALRKEVPISRGELIEIGGSFRIPDVMARAGAKLHEVGTTNRTHLKDFVAAISDKTGLVMRVHPSNFAIEGFTATVDEAELADACHARGVPLVVDLGSGALVDLRRFGLPHEPTPAETLAAGADLVTFSGDKLLGGPQAGIIVGRADLVARIKRNPMKRALRCDKVTLAALAAVLRLYHDPDRLVERLPTFRALARPLDALDKLANRIAPALRAALVGVADAEVIDCASQIGSGALPTNTVPSRGLAIRPVAAKRGAGTALKRIVAAFSQLPIPVLGAVSDGALVLDVRCLEDEAEFTAQLASLTFKPK